MKKAELKWHNETSLVQLQAWKFTTFRKRDSIADAFFEICEVYRTFVLKMFRNNQSSKNSQVEG